MEFMKDEDVNWFGWTIYQIAAVYETDLAMKEEDEGLVDSNYSWAAGKCEARKK